MVLCCVSAFLVVYARRDVVGKEPRSALIVPTLYLIGDSTVRNGKGDGANGQWGWGEPLVEYFDSRKISVINSALGGRSSRTYITGGQWERVRSQLRNGDFVIIQFGHNDSSAINDDSRARGTIRGTGEESERIDNLLTHEPEVVHSFGWYMRRYVRETREKGRQEKSAVTWKG